jgi:SMI1/KNR4 family protein SUKH-1
MGRKGEERTMEEQPERIRRKLARLRACDTAFTVFGASKHRYALNPCLSEEEISAIERALEISLPAGYREFLHEIGNGGAGPDYGLYSLQKSIAESFENATFLAAPFPHTDAWNLDPHRFGAQNVPGDQFAMDKAAFAAYEEEYSHDEHVQGALRIHTAGCNHDTLLVLNGSERGYVWHDERTVDFGVFPYEGKPEPNARLRFLDWYEDWLENALRAVDN